MLTEAIQTTLSPIVDAYGTNTGTASDDLPPTPFVVHSVDVQEVIRTKEGIAGYEYNLQVLIVGAEPSEVESTAALVIGELNAMEGTINSTIIVDVEEGTDDPVDFDPEIQKYTKTLNYNISTKNR